jgi:type IV secretory pathway protease TraF
VGPRRRLITALAAIAVGAAGWLAVPRRFVVEGVSMGPALLPGDVVRTGAFPAFDRLRRPRRFERWVLRAADGLAIKRIVGLPGEEVSIAGGDLLIDGDVVLKGPRLLADMGTTVADTGDPAPPPAEGWTWSRAAGEILDDAAFDPGSPRLLAAVADAGLAAIVDVTDASAATPVPIRLAVGGAVLPWSFAESGRHALVAGRLDGRLVAAAWPLRTDAALVGRRSCLPPGAPAAWQIVEPWPPAADHDEAPAMAIDAGADGRVVVVAVSRWRDGAYRPGADGRTSWRLAADDVFVLGDHSAASTDSRRWGPVAAATVRHRIRAAIP